MPDHLGPATTACDDVLTGPDHDDLRLLSRSPHPYHRQTSELLEPSTSSSYAARQSPQPTDSGTEADDEHFLKGLPAPRRLHKGLRGRNEALSGYSTPLLTPLARLDGQGRRLSSFGAKKGTPWNQTPSDADEWKKKRAREIIRRLTEILIVGVLGLSVYANAQVRPVLQRSSRGNNPLSSSCCVGSARPTNQ